MLAGRHFASEEYRSGLSGERHPKSLNVKPQPFRFGETRRWLRCNAFGF